MIRTKLVSKAARRVARLLTVVGLAGSLAACVTEQPKPPAPRHGPSPFAELQVYDCGNGVTFSAAYELNQAWLLLPERPVKLLPVESASGAQYEGEGITLWHQDDEALLILPTERHEGCQVDPRASVWSKAKLQGVDFRALGSEPGWYLEIDEGHRMVLVTDNGRHWHDLVAPEPQVDAAQGITRYLTQYQGRPVVVEIRRQTCTDASGESYDATVRVRVGPRSYSGCGRGL